MRLSLRQAVRVGVPIAGLLTVARPAASRRTRAAAGSAVLATWAYTYVRYRQRGIAATQDEWERLRHATPKVFARHYNECVPTVEEELDTWSAYHGHRHKMRYRLVGEAASAALPDGGIVLDIGCGSGLVADEILDRHATYLGIDFGGHHIEAAAKRHRDYRRPLRMSFIRGDGEHLPLGDGTVDVVVFTEVIEHLLRPELAVWEIARVLKPGGVLVMTTNNASEMPLRFPLADPGAFLEKALGFTRDRLISHRPWVWPDPVHPAILDEGVEAVWVPHTWHKQAETRRMFAAAGLETTKASTFEFPPPQSRSAAWFDRHGETGERLVDVLERVCTSVPLVNRLGCHLMMVARRTQAGVAEPPPGIWPGPFS